MYAVAKNATTSSSSSTLKGGGGSTSNSTSPIGSSTSLKVVTKVDNTKGGTKKPSDFTITVSGKSPSPKSFSGSTSGTSVTLKAGKYKVTASGPSGYTISYSSGCSGTASGGVPIKCTLSSWSGHMRRVVKYSGGFLRCCDDGDDCVGDVLLSCFFA